MRCTIAGWKCCKYLVVLAVLHLSSPVVLAGVDVDMFLNDGGFISFDHFLAELRLSNNGAVVPDAQIFGVLEVHGSFFFWPDFTSDVSFDIRNIPEGHMTANFLEFDFPDIDDFIPFGPMNFWGAWVVSGDQYGYDVQEFWLDSEHKWTPSPVPATFTPTASPDSPTFTPVIPTPTSTPPPPTGTPSFSVTPTNTPTLTPVPTFTPVPPTLTPTSTPTRTPTSTLTPTATPIFVSVGNMIAISAGTFMQGSPSTEPCRISDETEFTHTLTRNLVVMETEVTRQMWADLSAVQGTLPADPSDTSCSPSMIHPVQSLTWFESVLFANLLSMQNGYTRCYYTDAGFTTPVDASNYVTGPFFCYFGADGYRLATEGEWEYWGRAGTTTPFSCDEPNYTSGTCESCTSGTHPVLEQYCVYCANDPGMTSISGSKLANPWSLKDVHGNVWEWCWDWYGMYPTEAVTDYTGLTSGTERVIRGGAWGSIAEACRSAKRLSVLPYNRSNPLGFRLVRSP